MNFKITLVDEAKQFYKLYSIWFFAILGLMPDLYNLAVDNHLVDGGNAPAFLARVINIVAFAGAAMRLVKQKVVAEQVAQEAAAPADPPQK